MKKIPSLSSWIKSLQLFMFFIPTGIGIGFIYFWLFLIGAFLMGLISLFNPEKSSDTLLVIGFFLIIGLVFLGVTLALDYLLKSLIIWILHRLWDNPPQWLSPAKQFKQRIYNCIIATLSTFPMTLMLLIYVYLQSDGSARDFGRELGMMLRNQEEIENLARFMIKFSWLFIITSASLYEVKIKLLEKLFKTEPKNPN